MFQTNYNGFFDESEIEQNANRSKIAYEIGLAGFEDFTHHAENAIKRFNGFMDKVMRELPEVEKDLKNQVSVVKEQTRENLNQIFQNQASALASMSGGPVGIMMRNINNQASKMYHNQMNQGRIARLKEMQENNKLYHDVVSDRMDIARMSQQSLGQLINAVGAQNSQLAQAGLQSSVDATRLQVNLRLGASDYAIKRSKQQYDWWTSLLNAETSVYGAQMNYMANTFNTLSTAEAAKYDTDIRALTAVYNSQAETNRNTFQTAMGGMVGIYQSNTASRDRRDVAASNLGLGLYRINTWSATQASTNQAQIVAANHGNPQSVIEWSAGKADQYYRDMMSEVTPDYSRWYGGLAERAAMMIPGSS